MGQMDLLFGGQNPAADEVETALEVFDEMQTEGLLEDVDGMKVGCIKLLKRSSSPFFTLLVSGFTDLSDRGPKSTFDRPQK